MSLRDMKREELFKIYMQINQIIGESVLQMGGKFIESSKKGLVICPSDDSCYKYKKKFLEIIWRW